MTAITFIDGKWIEGNPRVLGPMDQSFWFATMVFDGARAFDGVAPDLDRHCQRALDSARFMGFAPKESRDMVVDIALKTAARFPRGSTLYIRPIFYADGGFLWPDPETTRFLMTVHEEPLPEPTGFATFLSRYRRPAPDSAPTGAKAACLYPIVGMAMKDATEKGFGAPVVLDQEGNVAEFATSNLFMVKDGVVHTPVPNGTFLNGITRQRVIGLFRDVGVEVVERTIGYEEVVKADEVFSTGNYAKVTPVTRIEDRHLQPGPMFTKARALYFEFARQSELRV